MRIQQEILSKFMPKSSQAAQVSNLGDSLATVHVNARQGHIHDAQKSSGTADFGVGYEVSKEDADEDAIEREYNMRASQIKAKFEGMGDSIVSGSFNDRDEDEEDQYAVSASNFNNLKLPSVDQLTKKQRPLSSVEPKGGQVTERSQVQQNAQRTVGRQQFSGGISQLDERTDMTSLNKDSTFERDNLSEMLSAGQKT